MLRSERPLDPGDLISYVLVSCFLSCLLPPLGFNGQYMGTAWAARGGPCGLQFPQLLLTLSAPAAPLMQDL